MGSLRAVLGVMLTGLLGVMLIATIYFTLFDLEWIAFLSGILFAALAALASQVSKAQWISVRRTRQLQRAREAITAQNAQLKHAAGAVKTAEARFKLLANALPAIVVYIDRDDRCRYFNRTFAQWCGRNQAPEEGVSARDALGDALYREFDARRGEVFSGREVRLEAIWQRPAGAPVRGELTLLPDVSGGGVPTGCYALITGAADDPAGSGELVFHEAAAAEPDDESPRRQLLRALQEDRFVLYAQAIRPLTGNTPYPRCLEVLLRLKDEQQGTLPPGGFFPVAERSNLMGEIDRWVVRNLIQWSVEKRREDPAWQPPLYCVNLAPASLADPGFASYVRVELMRGDYPAGSLGFEITEVDLAARSGNVRKLIDVLRPLGCRFTVQSFGKTGKIDASFALLKGMQFDFLKIDGTIVHDILTNPEDLDRIKAIASRSRNLGARTIAEFVESDDTVAKLRENGVDYAQGFGVGRPGPIARVA